MTRNEVMVIMMERHRVLRTALVVPPAIGLVFALAGCMRGTGSEASSLLFAEALARQPEMMKSVMRASVAAGITHADLTNEQAASLAAIARERGPAVREAVDKEMAPFREVAKRIDEATVKALQGADDEPDMDEVLMSLMGEDSEEMKRLQSLMLGQDSTLVGGVLEEFAADIDPVAETMSPEQVEKVANVLEGVQSALQYPEMAMAMQEGATPAEIEEAEVTATEEAAPDEPAGQEWETTEDFEPGDPGELDAATRTEAVMKALGYEDAHADEDRFARAQAIVEEFMGTPAEEQFTAAETLAKRIVGEVGPDAGMIRNRVRSHLVALIGLEAAPELLDIVATRK